MRFHLTLLLLTALFSSCATITNKKYTKIELHTRPDSLHLSLDRNTLVTTPVILQVPRSARDFKLRLTTDSVTAAVLFTSSVAPQIWGNLALGFFCPAGFIIDAFSKTKMFTYRKDILVDFTQPAPKTKQWYPDRTGKFFLILKIPGISFLRMDLRGTIKGFNLPPGLILGMDYYYKPGRFFSAESGLTGAIFPVYAGTGEISQDTSEYATAFVLKVNHNHDIKYASIGYGLNLSNYRYMKTIADTMRTGIQERKTISYWEVGINVNITFRLFQFLTLGFNYIPSFYNVSAGRFDYSQIIFLDLGMRLELGKQGRRKMKVIKWEPAYDDKL